MTGDYLSADTGTGEKPMGQGQCIFKELTLGMKVRSFNLLIAPVKYQMGYTVKINASDEVCVLSMHLSYPYHLCPAITEKPSVFKQVGLVSRGDFMYLMKTKQLSSGISIYALRRQVSDNFLETTIINQ